MTNEPNDKLEDQYPFRRVDINGTTINGVKMNEPNGTYARHLQNAGVGLVVPKVEGGKWSPDPLDIETAQRPVFQWMDGSVGLPDDVAKGEWFTDPGGIMRKAMTDLKAGFIPWLDPFDSGAFSDPPKLIDRNSPESKAEAARVAQAYLDSSDEGTRMSWEYQSKTFDGPMGPQHVRVLRVGDTFTPAEEAAITNTSGLYATEFKILILADEVEKVTKGGIIRPESNREAEQFATTEGTIIDVAPGAFTYLTDAEWGDKKPRVGDKVIYAKYAGKIAKGNDGKDYTFMNDRDLCGIRRV